MSHAEGICAQPDCHDELCDVIVEDPVPIRFGLGQVWYADIVAQATGLDPLDLTDDEQVAFATLIVRTYDTVKRMQKGGSHTRSEQETLRNAIRRLLAEGNSMLDVPDILGLSWEATMRAFTLGNPSLLWGWDEARWLQAEVLMEHGVTMTVICRELNVPWSSRETMRRLWRMYGRTVGSARGVKLDAVRDMIRKHPEMSNKMLASRIFDELGESISDEQVGERRRYLRRIGELAA